MINKGGDIIMTHSDLQAEIEQLDIAERILLAEEIWNSIAVEQERVGVTQAQKNELDRRLEHYRESPDEGCSWDEAKKRIRSPK